MKQENQNNTVASTDTAEMDAYIQSAIDGNNYATVTFWVVAIAFLVVFYVVHKKHKNAVDTEPVVEYSPLSTFALSESLSLSSHQKCGEDDK